MLRFSGIMSIAVLTRLQMGVVKAKDDFVLSVSCSVSRDFRGRSSVMITLLCLVIEFSSKISYLLALNFVTNLMNHRYRDIDITPEKYNCSHVSQVNLSQD